MEREGEGEGGREREEEGEGERRPEQEGSEICGVDGVEWSSGGAVALTYPYHFLPPTETAIDSPPALGAKDA